MKRCAFFCAVLASLFLLGCPKEGPTRSSVRTRQEIDTFIAANSDLSDTDKAALIDGEYTIGMSAKAIKFILGEPEEVQTIKQPWATQEAWLYKRGGKKRFIIEDGGVVDLFLEE